MLASFYENMEKILTWLIQTWWLITFRCKYCGGQCNDYGYRRIYCEDCNKVQ